MKLITDDLQILRKPCDKITLPSGLKLGRDLLQFLKLYNKEHLKGGIGLAAPQVGIHKRVAVLLFKINLILVNPEIVEYSTEKFPVENEGCLSFPGETVNTFRHLWIKVKSDNFKEVKTFGPTGPHEMNSTNILRSIAVQHEVDHLNSVLIFDRTEK